jgi:predicted nucleotidyltransferase
LFDWSLYNGGLAWLPERTIYITLSGSHSYGTNIATSDVDYRGIAIPPKQYYLGINNRFEQAEQNNPDLTIFDLRKYIELAANANPNVLELLYTDPKDHLLVTSLGQKLIDNREIFLSQKAKHTFSGYAISQLKRINSHRRYLLNPPSAPPTRTQFGLPERTVIPHNQLEAATAAIRKRVDSWNWNELDNLSPADRQAIQDEFTNKLIEITQWSFDEIEDRKWSSAAKSLGFDSNFIELLDKERQYTQRHNEWVSYLSWKENRNKARGETERKYGYCTKHAGHLYRLMVMAREILKDGKVIVKRPDAAEILNIRNGGWSYERLVKWAEEQDKELSEIMKTSKLPKSPNRNKIDELCVSLVEESFGG